MIPKTCLANVFAKKDATTDGIHLTQAGQTALAGAVEKMLVVWPDADRGPATMSP
jgi:hypothetical protein